jgi:hypothetical protein
VVIGDLDLAWTFLGPDEAEAPLVVDADAPLTSAIAPQRLEPIARRDAEITQAVRRIQIDQLAGGDSRDRTPSRRADRAPKKPLGVTILKALDHDIL